ncbi:hypothetical protein CI610_02916 [invertebrate metagenome]|uniref:SapC family protein n=1 Tax=invertebrate metagenome TaxID=1711999 RepID=A0A2H9T4L0_9ZZZZ
MATLLFYKKPALLNRELHKTLRFKASSDYSFTEHINSVPLTGIEFFEASRDMPVLFSKDEKGDFLPLALLSLLKDGHRQLGESGSWTDTYVPAFVRRYPFALTDDGNVCLDEEAPHFSHKEGELLFNEEGNNSETLTAIVNFLNHYDQQYKNTRAFCAACKEQALFTPFNLQVMLGKKKPLRLEGLFAIDEKKLTVLPEDKVSGWFRSGWLAWSYAHLHSLGALNRLVKRQRQESPSEEEITDEIKPLEQPVKKTAPDANKTEGVSSQLEEEPV